MIVHIVPSVPPDVNGLADYCFNLSRSWPQNSIRWGCLALHIPPGAQNCWPDATLIGFEASQQSLDQALQKLPIDTLILHYVGYAYDAKGTPKWLIASLKKWRDAHPQARLAVMFHELWASGAPWRSCFWVLPIAQSIVTALAQISDFWVTSCDYYFNKVVSVGGQSERGAVIPIATGITPSKTVDFQRPWPLFCGQKLEVAVFGMVSTRNSALSLHAALLRALCEQGLVSKITLLGRSAQNNKDLEKFELLKRQIGFEPLWHCAYDLSPQEISTLLAEHHIGLVKETTSLIYKSSVFAVLCSHGVISICTGRDSLTASAFLTNFDKKSCVLALQNQEAVNAKKRNIEALTTSSLSWTAVSNRWMNHIGRRP